MNKMKLQMRINAPLPLCRLITAILFLCTVSLSAQTAAELDILLNTREVSTAGAARVILEAAKLLPEGLYGEEAQNAAYKTALSMKWLTKEPDEALTMKDAAFLVMKAFDMKGGLMYSLFHSPRYAYREMVYRKLIQGRSDPAMHVSGPGLLQIMGGTLNFIGEDIQFAQQGEPQ